MGCNDDDTPCGDETYSCDEVDEICNSCVKLVSPCHTGCRCRKCLPTPFYQNQICQEDNSKVIVNTKYTGSLKTTAPFNMPGCGISATVVFAGLKQILLNSRLWSFGVGYLTVIAFNPDTSAVTLRNDCDSVENPDNQAPIGTLIPACTQFIPAPTNNNSSSGSPSGIASAYPYVAVAFTAPPASPAVGSCINISVTNTNGLSVGKAIQIAGGTYILQSITSSTLITICNNGAGVTSGTPIDAQIGGVYVTPIVLIDSNACTNLAVTSGKIIVCKDDISQPLIGSANGQVPVLDVLSGEVNFRDLLIPVGDCTNLTICFTVDPDLPDETPYLVTVGNTAIFTVGDSVVINGTPFQVDEIINSTQMRLIPNTPPTAIQTYAVGAAVCDADCCTTLTARVVPLEAASTDHEARLDVLENPCTLDTGIEVGAATATSGAGSTSSINTVGVSADGPNAEVLITNPSTCKTMIGTFHLNYEWDGEVEGTNGQWLTVGYTALSGQAVGLIGSTVTPVLNAGISSHETIQITGGGGALIRKQGNNYTLSQAFSIPPGNEIRVKAAARVTLVDGASGVIARNALKQSRVTVHALAT